MTCIFLVLSCVVLVHPDDSFYQLVVFIRCLHRLSSSSGALVTKILATSPGPFWRRCTIRFFGEGAFPTGAFGRAAALNLGGAADELAEALALENAECGLSMAFEAGVNCSVRYLHSFICKL